MNRFVPMPTLSASMESGVVTKWRVAVGDQIAEGQIIAEIETDKSVLEYESPDSGRVARLIAQERTQAVPVGQPILELASEQQTESGPVVGQGDFQGDHRGGDFLPFSPIRRAIADKVSESKRSVPHFYASLELRMDFALKALSEMAVVGSEPKPSINSLILRAVALALRSEPALNVQYAGNGVVALKSIDIGVIIATSEGIFAPVLRSVDTKTLAQIGEEVALLRSSAERRGLVEHDYADAAVSVSNLGMYGIDSFAAIVNPPQVMVLAVGKVAPRAVVEQGVVLAANTMQCILSCDHRVIDGAAAARFLAKLQSSLSNGELFAT
jgi:pyruvate dehydrogenase E2 component (dihydrolipoamide acetyltransferase)